MKWLLPFKALCWAPFFLLFTSFSVSATVNAPFGFANANTTNAVLSDSQSAALSWCQENYPLTTQVQEWGGAGTAQIGIRYVGGVSYYFTAAGQDPTRNKSFVCQKADGSSSGSWTASTAAFCVGGFPWWSGSAYVCASSCPPPTVDDGAGNCITNPCPSAGSVTYPTALDGGFFIATQSTAPTTGANGTSFCLPHSGALCEVKCSTGVAGPNPIASGYAVACTSLSATGAMCPSGASTLEVNVPNPLAVEPETGPGTEPTQPGDCPPGTGFAQVNNVSMCLPAGTSGTGPTSSSSSSSGTQTSTSSSWSVNPDSSVSVTTNTSVTTQNGTETATSTETVGGSAPSSGNSSTANLGPAPAADTSEVAGLNPDLVAAAPLPLIDVNLTRVGSAGSCPAPITFSAMGQNFTFDFAALCDWAGFFKAFLLIVAGFAALRILVMA